MDNWLTASMLDRVDAHRENPEWVADQWKHPDAWLLPVDARGSFAVDDSTGRLQLVRPAADYDPQRHFLLGRVDGAPVFVEETPVAGDAPLPLRLMGRRFNDLDREIATVATALLGWHRSDRHCARCGGTCVAERGGFTRRCTTCGAEQFPRHDPAVIVAAIDDHERIFLGHHRDWDDGRMSLLAGFVEVGESFEQAVHREVAEEASLRLDAVQYVGSQPWPFPRSLMVGFVAHASDSTFGVDEQEITYAEWLSRSDVRDRVEAGTLKLPGGASIAHRIIEDWLAKRLPDPRS